jgi:secreted trypsin-like serine protease
MRLTGSVGARVIAQAGFVGFLASSFLGCASSPLSLFPVGEETSPGELVSPPETPGAPYGDSESTGNGGDSLPSTASRRDSAEVDSFQLAIVGGEDRDISWAPWQVALVWESAGSDWQGQFCGGSLISASWVVTAAHCLHGLSESEILSDLRIVSGEDVLDQTEVSDMTVSKVVLHPAYNDTTYANDIALLKLRTPLILRVGSVGVLSLPSTEPAANTLARISGWGSTWVSDEVFDYPFFSDSDTQFPTQLQGAEVWVQSGSQCASDYGDQFDDERMLCASVDYYLVDTCQGDSGGPLATLESGRWVLSGVTSWGSGCAWISSGLYTNVANYHQWISANVAVR